MGAVGSIAGGLGIGSAVKDIYDEGTKGNTIETSSGSRSGINLAPSSQIEKKATNDIGSQYDFLKKFLTQGPGVESVQDANASQQDYVNLLSLINSTGGMPTADDRRMAEEFVNTQFSPQQEALNQSFQFQQQDAARLAAQLNRPINDPIIQAKLRQEQMRQQSMLDANRSAAVSAEARNSPFQRLALQGQLADTRGSLASQAMSNRMQLLNLGNAIQSQERNWRLQTSDRWGTQNGSQHSGGGILGGIGAVAGAVGSVTGMVNQVAGLAGGKPGMGGGGGSTVQDAQATPSVNIATAPGGFLSPGGYQSTHLGTLGASQSPVSSSYAAPRGYRFASPIPASAPGQSPYYISNSPNSNVFGSWLGR